MCEVQTPTDISNLLKLCTIEENQGNDIPESVMTLESILSQPVTTFNAVYRQQKLKQEKTTNVKSEQTEELHDKKGVCLKAGYKNAAIVTDKRKYKQMIYGERSNHKEHDLALPMSRLAVDASTKNLQSSSNRTNDTKRAVQNGTMKETTCTSQQANKMVPSGSSKLDSRPCLQHTFAEGPDLTLVDIALFPYIQFYMAYIDLIGATHILSAIPMVVKWYRQMLDVPNILETCVQCGIPMVRLQAADIHVVKVQATDIDDLSLFRVKHKTDFQKTEFCKGKSR